MLQSRTFFDRAEADQFADRCEELHDYVSMTVVGGEFIVRFGEQRAADWSKMAGDIARQDEAEISAEFERECTERGTAESAAAAVQMAGLEGRDAEVFAAGFAGQDPKAMLPNPRADGREAIYKAGRKAATSREGQQAIRAAAVRARAVVVRRNPRPVF